jgi:hypothetical protein
MVMEFTIIQMELNTKETGMRISNMDMERKVGLIVLCMKVITRMERKMVKANLFGVMELRMMENFSRTIFMVFNQLYYSIRIWRVYME